MADAIQDQLLILYGSQTGTAQDLAERISRQGRRRHFKMKVLPMDSYDKVFTAVIIIIIICVSLVSINL